MRRTRAQVIAVPPSVPDATLYDGVTASELRDRLGAPRVELLHRVSSTLDVAHSLATDGAPSGTLVLAEEQTAGRGRGGRRWLSAPGAGIWLTLLERGTDPAAAATLTLRVGIRSAAVLDRFVDAPVRLKWPNDLFVGDRKLGGILLEARWRGGRIDWVAIGIGLNVRMPATLANAGALRAETSRLEVLAELVPAVRAAASACGPLTPSELERYAARDLARGRRCLQPVPGEVRGLNVDGSLVVCVGDRDVSVRSGSLVLEDA